MINNYFNKVLLLSFSGSIIALILFAAKPYIRLKLSKRWQYYIWLIVILRLLLPFTPKVSLLNSVYSLFNDSILMKTSIQALQSTKDIIVDNQIYTITIIIEKYIGIVWLSIVLILL